MATAHDTMQPTPLNLDGVVLSINYNGIAVQIPFDQATFEHASAVVQEQYQRVCRGKPLLTHEGVKVDTKEAYLKVIQGFLLDRQAREEGLFAKLQAVLGGNGKDLMADLLNVLAIARRFAADARHTMLFQPASIVALVKMVHHRRSEIRVDVVGTLAHLCSVEDCAMSLAKANTLAHVKLALSKTPGSVAITDTAALPASGLVISTGATPAVRQAVMNMMLQLARHTSGQKLLASSNGVALITMLAREPLTAAGAFTALCACTARFAERAAFFLDGGAMIELIAQQPRLAWPTRLCVASALNGLANARPSLLLSPYMVQVLSGLWQPLVVPSPEDADRPTAACLLSYARHLAAALWAFATQCSRLHATPGKLRVLEKPQDMVDVKLLHSMLTFPDEQVVTQAIGAIANFATVPGSGALLISANIMDRLLKFLQTVTAQSRMQEAVLSATCWLLRLVTRETMGDVTFLTRQLHEILDLQQVDALESHPCTSYAVSAYMTVQNRFPTDSALPEKCIRLAVRCLQFLDPSTLPFTSVLVWRWSHHPATRSALAVQGCVRLLLQWAAVLAIFLQHPLLEVEAACLQPICKQPACMGRETMPLDIPEREPVSTSPSPPDDGASQSPTAGDSDAEPQEGEPQPEDEPVVTAPAPASIDYEALEAQTRVSEVVDQLRGRASTMPLSALDKLELVLGAMSLLTHDAGARDILCGASAIPFLCHLLRLPEKEYDTVVHLAIRVVWKLVEVNAAARKEALHQHAIASSLVDVASNESLLPATRLTAFALLHALTSAPHAPESVEAEVANTDGLIDPFVKIRLLVAFLRCEDVKAQGYGAHMLARLAKSQVEKRLVAKIGGSVLLAKLVQHCRDPEVVRDAVHAVLNLTTDEVNQRHVGRSAIEPLLQFARSDKFPQIRDLAAQAILNIQRHTANRSKLYVAEFRTKSRDVLDLTAQAGLRPPRNVRLCEEMHAQSSTTAPSTPPPDLRLKHTPSLPVLAFLDWCDIIGASNDEDVARAEAELQRSRQELRSLRPKSPGPTSPNLLAVDDDGLRALLDSLSDSDEDPSGPDLTKRIAGVPASLTTLRRTQKTQATSVSDSFDPVVLNSGPPIGHRWKPQPVPLTSLTPASLTIPALLSEGALHNHSSMDCTYQSAGTASKAIKSVKRAQSPTYALHHELRAPLRHLWTAPEPPPLNESTVLTQPSMLSEADKHGSGRARWMPQVSQYHIHSHGSRPSTTAAAPHAARGTTPGGGAAVAAHADDLKSPFSLVVAPSTTRHRVLFDRSSDEWDTKVWSELDSDMQRLGFEYTTHSITALPKLKSTSRYREHNAFQMVDNRLGTDPRHLLSATSIANRLQHSPLRASKTAGSSRPARSQTSETVGSGGFGPPSPPRSRGGSPLPPELQQNAGRHDLLLSSSAMSLGTSSRPHVSVEGTSHAEASLDDELAFWSPMKVLESLSRPSTTHDAPPTSPTPDPLSLANATTRLARAIERTKRVDPEPRTPFIRMYKFNHVEGCQTCHGLYDHYRLPNGKLVHYYVDDSLQEVVNAVHVEAPAPPLELVDILQTQYPSPPVPAQLRANEFEAPYAPGLPCPPPANPWAGSEITFGVFDDTSHLKAAADANARAATKNQWTLPKSVFGPRRMEADVKGYVDTPAMLLNMLEVDWTRVCAKERFRRLVQTASHNDPDILPKILDVLKPYYNLVRFSFDYYALLGSAADSFSIQMNAFSDFVEETDILEPNSRWCSHNDLQTIFVSANVEDRKDTETSKVNNDRSLLRFEWLECLIRISIAKYMKTEIAAHLPSAVKMVMENNMSKLNPMVIHDSNSFRAAYLYNQPIDRLFSKYLTFLRHLFDKFCEQAIASSSKKPRIAMSGWLRMLSKLQLLDDRFYIREAKLCFVWSRMAVSDEVKNRVKWTTLSFVDFLEALARVAMMNSMPTAEDFAKLEVTDVYSYYEKLTAAQSAGMPRRASAEFGAAPTRPLLEKLGMLLDLIQQRAQAYRIVT